MAAEFKDGSDLFPVVKKVLSENPEFNYLKSNQIILRRREADKESQWAARIKLVPSAYKDIFGMDKEYIIEVDSLQYDVMSDENKEALIYHELLHSFYDSEKDKYKLVKHDVEEFLSVLKKYPNFRKKIKLAED